MSSERKVTYQEAISEATLQALSRDRDVFVIGLGVRDYKGIFGTTIESAKKYGPERVIESPASEGALTGIVIGASVMGKKPIIIHARNDFMFLTLDEMCNSAAKWKYMYDGKSKAGITVRGIIGKGWGQGPTHSQSIQSIFMHFPGIYVAMPSTPYDAKGFLLSSIDSGAPCVILEHRALYNNIGVVPQKPYKIDFGKARTVKKGKDITVVASSIMVQEAVKAAIQLEKCGISLEVIDPRTLKPLDEGAIIQSVRKTGRLIICDTSWITCGFASEVAAIVSEKALEHVKCPIKRICLPECPSPVSKSLEDVFYPTYKDIFIESAKIMKKDVCYELIKDPVIDNFKGPY